MNKKIILGIALILVVLITTRAEEPVRIVAKNNAGQGLFNDDPCTGKSVIERPICITAWCDSRNLNGVQKAQCLGQLAFGDYQCIKSDGTLESIGKRCEIENIKVDKSYCENYGYINCRENPTLLRNEHCHLTPFSPYYICEYQEGDLDDVNCDQVCDPPDSAVCNCDQNNCRTYNFERVGGFIDTSEGRTFRAPRPSVSDGIIGCYEYRENPNDPNSPYEPPYCTVSQEECRIQCSKAKSGEKQYCCGGKWRENPEECYDICPPEEIISNCIETCDYQTECLSSAEEILNPTGSSSPSKPKCLGWWDIRRLWSGCE
jgi:hypothetical protein